MGALITTAHTKIYIGSAAMAFSGTDVEPDDFEDVTWVEIKGHTDLGSSGDTSELVTSNQIGIGRTRKAKGTRNAGSKTLVVDFDPADAGQLALLAAEKTSHSYPFRLVFDDAPAGGTPSERFFIAFIMGFEEQFAGANDAVKVSVTLELDSNIARIAAAEATP